MKQCPECRGVNIDSGKIRTAGLMLQSAWDPTVYYESYNKKFLAGKTPIYAEVCTDCGHIEFVVPPSHLSKRIKK